MNRKYKDFLFLLLLLSFSSEACAIYSKNNVDDLFVVSDLEQWLNFGKGTVTETELISSRSNALLLDENFWISSI